MAHLFVWDVLEGWMGFATESRTLTTAALGVEEGEEMADRFECKLIDFAFERKRMQKQMDPAKPTAANVV